MISDLATNSPTFNTNHIYTVYNICSIYVYSHHNICGRTTHHRVCSRTTFTDARFIRRGGLHIYIHIYMLCLYIGEYINNSPHRLVANKPNCVKQTNRNRARRVRVLPTYIFFGSMDYADANIHFLLILLYCITSANICRGK